MEWIVAFLIIILAYLLFHTLEAVLIALAIVALAIYIVNQLRTRRL